MDAPVRGSLRWARASVTGLWMVLLSLGGHVAVARTELGIVQLIAAYAIAALSALLLTSAKLRPLRTASTLVCGQIIFHLCFSLSHRGPACGNHHGGSAPMECQPTPVLHSTHVSMLMAHVIAGLLIALLLCYGDELLFRLTDLLHPLARAPHACGFSGVARALGIGYLAPALVSEIRWTQPPARAPPSKAY